MPARSLTLYLSPLQKEVLDGCLLGDGYISAKLGRARGSQSERFGYASIHEDAVQFVADSFFPLSMRTPYAQVQQGGFLTDRPIFKTYSPSSVTFEQQRHRWYIDGEKIVPFDLRLTRTVGLFWHLGDGSLNRNRVNLSTQGFSWGDVRVVLLPQLHALGMESAKALPERGKPRIWFSVADSERWLNFIGPPPVPSLMYRWETTRSYVNEKRYTDGTIRRSFSNETLDALRRDFEAGCKPTGTALKYGCSRNTIASMFQRWRNDARGHS